MFYLQSLLFIMCAVGGLILMFTRELGYAIFVGVVGGAFFWVVFFPIIWLVNGAYS